MTMNKFIQKLESETKKEYLQRVMNDERKVYIPLTDRLWAEASPADNICIVKLADDIYGVTDFSHEE